MAAARVLCLGGVGGTDQHGLQRRLQQFVLVEQGAEAEEVAVQLAGEGGDDPIGLFPVSRIAGDVEEAGQDADHDAVAGGRGIVGGGLGADDHVSGICMT